LGKKLIGDKEFQEAPKQEAVVPVIQKRKKRAERPLSTRPRPPEKG